MGGGGDTYHHHDAWGTQGNRTPPTPARKETTYTSGTDDSPVFRFEEAERTERPRRAVEAVPTFRFDGAERAEARKVADEVPTFRFDGAERAEKARKAAEKERAAHGARTEGAAAGATLKDHMSPAKGAARGGNASTPTRSGIWALLEQGQAKEGAAGERGIK